MTRASKAAAVTLDITHRGTTYIIAPLSEADWAELEGWMQEKTYDQELALIEKIPEAMAELREKKTSEAYDRCRKIVIGGTEAGKILLSVSGSLRVAWLAMRQHNAITIDEVAKLCNDKEFQAKINAKVNSMNLADPEDVLSAGKRAKKKARKKKAPAKRRTKRKTKPR